MSPRSVAEWLSSLADGLTLGVLRDLALWLILALVVAVLVRVLRRWVSREVEDVNRRHKIRKSVGYAGAVLVVLVGVGFLVGRSVHVAAVLGILGAGAAIALQDVAKSTVGWIYLSSRAGISPGARVEIDGVVGEVIDVGVLKTTILEVGNLVEGRQSSGRLATVPNSRFLSQTSLFSPDYSPFAWHEVSFLLTFESDWERGVAVLEELGREQHEEYVEGEVETGFRRLERNYAFKHGPLTPIVYVVTRDSGVQLTLRFLTHIRQRRGSQDRISRAMLEAVDGDEALEFAYPTWRVYHRGEGEPPPRGPGPSRPTGPA
jgi:small-conductance mechanosensitive channel